MKHSKLHGKKTVGIITVALLFAVQFFSVSFCFSADYLMKAFRGETLFVRIPSTWTAEEISSLDKDVEMIESGTRTFKVLELKDEEANRQAVLWVNADPSDNGYYYCDTEEDAEEYFDECGSAALDYIIEEAFPDADNWSLETDYIKGEDDFTYVIRSKAKIEDKDYVIYQACDFTANGGVNEALIFEGAGDLETRERIACSLEGYGYATELIDNNEYSTGTGSTQPSYYRDNDDESDGRFGSVIASIIWIVIWAAAIAFAVKKIRGMHGQRQPARSRPVRKATDKWVFKEFKPKRRDHEEHADCQARSGSRYAGYRESLITLHKSGLLTTKEMNELLEKHKNDI